MRRLLIHHGLALLLLFAQQVGVMHLAAHAAGRLQGGDDPAPISEQYCAKCALYAVGFSPPAVVPPPVPVVRVLRDRPPAAVPHVAVRHVALYRSRAPPVSL